MNICICSKCRSHSSTLSRERRKGRRQMTATRRLTDLKYIFSLFLTKRYKGNMSKCQNVLNLDYGYMVVSFIFFSAHFWMFHIFHKDNNLKIVFLLPLKSLGYDKPSNANVSVVCLISHMRQPDPGAARKCAHLICPTGCPGPFASHHPRSKLAMCWAFASETNTHQKLN